MKGDHVTIRGLGVAYVCCGTGMSTLDALGAAPTAVRGLEPLLRYGNHAQSSLVMRLINPVEDSMSRAWALRYWNANL